MKGDVLEIGSGTGTISQRIVENSNLSSSVTLTDLSQSYVQKLISRFLAEYTDNKNDKKRKKVMVKKLDLNVENDYEIVGYDSYDSIVAINVLEHVQDDVFALQQLYNMLRNGGNIAVLVPCYKFLYNAIDTRIGHFRRYSKPELIDKLNASKFIVNRIFYFNVLGIIGWYFNGNVLRRAIINPRAVQVLDRLVPILRQFEILTRAGIGLSIICWASKRSNHFN